MSMFSIKGVLVHVFKSPERINDDGKTTGGDHKIQIMGDVPLQDGGFRKDLVTLTAHDVSRYEDLEGTEITVPVGVFSPGKGQVIYYIPKGV